MREQHYFPVCPCICRRPIVCHAVSQTIGRNSPKLATSLPLIVSLCESNIIFLCVRPCLRHPSICPHAISSYTTRRNSTNLATSLPPMVRVCESNIFMCVRPSLRLSSVHMSVTLTPSKPLGGIQPNLLHHFPSW